MKKMIYILVVICIAYVCAAEISDSHRDASKKLYRTMVPRELFVKNFMLIFQGQLEQMAKMGIDQGKLKKIEKAAHALAEKVADDPQMEKKMTAVYAEAFTENEIKDLIAFYSTPTGQKALLKMPELFQKEAQIGQELTLKHQDDFQKKIKAIMEGED